MGGIAWREKPISKYEIIIYWSQADEAFIAEVLRLPACAVDGKTYKDASEGKVF